MAKRGKALEPAANVLEPPPGRYNPLDRINLARSIEGELLSRDVTPVSQEFMIQRVTDFLAERPMAPLPRTLKKRQAIADALGDAGLEDGAE